MAQRGMMKATVEATTLQAAMKAVSKAMGNRTSMPILNTVKLSANGSGLELMATDLNTWARVAVRGLVVHDDGPNEAVVGSQAFDYVKALQAGDITIEACADDVTRIGAATFAGLPVMDYPELDRATELTLLAVFEGKQLKDIIKRVAAFAHPPQTARLKLTGINFNGDGTTLSLVATDGYRMIRETFPSEFEGSFIVSAATLKRFAQVIPNKANVTLYRGEENRLVMKFDHVEWNFRDIAEEYPDFNRVIPTTNQPHTTVQVDSVALLRLLGQAKPFAPDGGMVKLSLLDDSLEVSTKDFAGRISARIQHADVCSAIAFDVFHIIDVCKVGGELTFALTSPLQGARISVAGRPELTMVQMPMSMAA